MGQSLVRLTSHLVFSTKHREPMIPGELRDDVNAYLSGAFKRMGCSVLAANCVADHVHVLCLLSKDLGVSKVLEEVKKTSSKWMKTKSERLSGFYWQTGYGAFSVSESKVAEVKAYIANQEEHHRRMTFQEELVILLKRHNVDYDPRYIWD